MKREVKVIFDNEDDLLMQVLEKYKDSFKNDGLILRKIFEDAVNFDDCKILLERTQKELLEEKQKVKYWKNKWFKEMIQNLDDFLSIASKEAVGELKNSEEWIKLKRYLING